MRVFLVGFMGSGKSHRGKELAERLGYSLLDIDEEIEAQGRSIPEIFSTDGEFRFREIERDALHAVQQDDIVVATGGGAACFHGNLDWMKEHGVVIYLKADVDVLIERMTRKKEERPLIADIPDNELPAFVSDLLKERETFYLQAHLTLHVD